jgi:hypothetical protein
MKIEKILELGVGVGLVLFPEPITTGAGLVLIADSFNIVNLKNIL